MTTDDGRESAEDQIRKLVEERVEAVRARDSGRASLSYAPNVVSFDVVNPLKYVGADAIRKRMEEWFASLQGPIGYETRDLSITAVETVAFCRSLNHVSGMTVDGGKLDMWWRATLCFCKIDEKWMLTHEHNSVPFDTNSGKASLDLKP